MTDKMSAAEFREYLQKQEKARDSKYGGVPTQTADGQKFRSHVEAAFYNKMLLLQRAGEVTLIEREVRYEFIVDGVFITWYMLDFRITYADGRIEYVDTKSSATMTPLFRIKCQLMKALYQIDVLAVFWEDVKGLQRVEKKGKK